MVEVELVASKEQDQGYKCHFRKATSCVCIMAKAIYLRAQKSRSMDFGCPISRPCNEFKAHE